MRTLLIVLIFGLCSCSLFSSSNSKSLPIPNHKQALRAAKLKSKQLSDDPYIYRLSSKEKAEQGQPYATLLEDCAETNRPDKLSSSVRQLLVGFKNLRTQGRLKLTVDEQPILVSSYSAKLDEAPLDIKTYSFIKGECVYDLVLWEKIKDAVESEHNSSMLLSATERFDLYAQAVLTSILK